MRISAQVTGRVVESRRVERGALLVPNEDGVLKSGMPADAWIRWREEAPWPERLVVPRS